LTVIDTSCEEEHDWKIRLNLENISSKVVHGYEVAWAEGYEHRKMYDLP
jgi:hypothetical protein